MKSNIKKINGKWIGIEEAQKLWYKTDEVADVKSEYLQAKNAYFRGDSKLVEKHVKSFSSIQAINNGSDSLGLFEVSFMKSKINVESSYSRRIRKRSDMDIMASILNEAHKGSKKTRIMYRCNLSYRQLQIYLKLLLGMGLLGSHSEKDSSKLDLFKTTEKGLKFLDAYRTLKALMT